MIGFLKIVFALILFLFGQFVDSINDPSQYCDLEKYCTADGLVTSNLHIGCPVNYNRSKSNYKVLKLKYNERNFIVNELNQFRSDVALGEMYAKQLSPLTFSYMKKLKWNFELDHLLQLMIAKHSNKLFYCMSTNDDYKPIQIVLSVNQPQPFSLQKLFSLAIEEVKSKALQGYSIARQNEIINWSQFYHQETWSFACAVGEIITSALNDKDMLIRCAFYGKKFKKNKVDFEFGELCSGCGNDGCSDLFPGLCGSDFDNFRGVKGINGPLGNVGESGKPGAKGEKGAKGLHGIPGFGGKKGLKGPTGPQGPTGIPAATPPKGKKGIPGKTANSEDCPGSPGVNGINGVNGPDGPDGATGEAGDKGEPANQTKGDKGDSGLSIKGERGDIGDNGDIGLAGPVGEQGLRGEKGDSNQNIKFGHGQTDGIIICTKGIKGSPGLPGPPGMQGPDAEPPKSTEIPIEVSTKPYRPEWY